MNLKSWLSAGAVMLATGFSGSAMAADGEPDIGTFSANVGLFSDYTFRGISQTTNEPALQGGIDWSHDIGLYAGMWGSSVDFGDGDQASLEVDGYGGYTGTIGGFTYDIGFIYYAYPGASSPRDYDYWEIGPKLSYDFGFMTVGVGYSYSPDFFNESGDAHYYEANAEVPLPAGFTLSGLIARQNIDDNVTFALPDYTTWSVGLSFDLGTLHSKLSALSLSATYVDTDIDSTTCGSDICDARGIIGISASF
jgi:uncharacterized protein (TIGR02001 family)